MFRRTQTSLLPVMAWIFFAAATLLPTTASAAGYGVSPADAVAIVLVSSGSLLVLVGSCGGLLISQRDQLPTPDYPTPLRVPNLESAAAVRAPSMRGSFDVPAGPDGYGIRLATRQPRPGIAGGAGPSRNHAPTRTSAAREPQRLAETAVE